MSVATVQESFDELSSAIPATIGMAIAAPGQPGVFSLGRWSVGVAWSTIKVPLAIAALRADRRSAQPLVVKAITESDNAAAELLWSQLGEPAAAARRVQHVVAAAADPTTVVESRRLRTEFTAFGQTQWALQHQALFAANLSGVPDAALVIELMKQLIPDHRWGLARKDVAAKGGWGPGVNGGYLTRQFGIVPVGASRVGVALAAETDTFEAGITALDQLTEWLFEQLAQQ